MLHLTGRRRVSFHYTLPSPPQLNRKNPLWFSQQVCKIVFSLQTLMRFWGTLVDLCRMLTAYSSIENLNLLKLSFRPTHKDVFLRLSKIMFPSVFMFITIYNFNGTVNLYTKKKKERKKAIRIICKRVENSKRNRSPSS